MQMGGTEMGYGISNPWPRWARRLYRFLRPPVPCGRGGKLTDPWDLFVGRVWDYDGRGYYPRQVLVGVECLHKKRRDD